MKRKIFTLLVAFMALAAFQANAAGSGAPHFLNVYGFGSTHYPNDELPIKAGGSSTQMGVLSYDSDNLEFVFRLTGTVGRMGNFDDYFVIDNDPQNRPNCYIFSHYEPNTPSTTFTIGGNSVWEVVQFDQVGTGFPVHAGNLNQAYTEGGYLCVPSSLSGNDNGRKILVWEVLFPTPPNPAGEEGLPSHRGVRKLKLITYKEYLESLSPGNTNPTASYTAKYCPVWVQIEGLKGRWAQKQDLYDKYPDFIQIKGFQYNDTLRVKGTDGKMYDKFKVALTGAYNWKKSNHGNAGTHKNDPDIYRAVPYTDPEYRDSTTTYYNLDNNGRGNTGTNNGFLVDSFQIQLFSFISPENASNVITVGRAKNVFRGQTMANNNVFGDSLILQKPYKPYEPLAKYGGWATDPNNEGTNQGRSINVTDDSLRTQQFGIWIEPDGALWLYPYAAWEYVYGSEDNPAIDLELRKNFSILYNTPSVSPTYNPHLNPFANEFPDYCFRLGFVKEGINEYALAPTNYNNINVYDIRKDRFYFYDVTRYNQIDEKRYYYLESNIIGRDNKPLVLDMVKQKASNGNWYNKLVLTDREADRFRYDPANPKDSVYYDTPYDSLNLSSAWSVKAIYNTDIDRSNNTHNYSGNRRFIIGYVIKNEEGDTLTFAPNGTPAWGGSGLADDVTNALMAFAPNNNYVSPNVYTDSVTSQIWKTVGFEGEKDGYFFMDYLWNAKTWNYQEDRPNSPKRMRSFDWYIKIDTINNQRDYRYNNFLFDPMYGPDASGWNYFFRSGHQFVPGLYDAPRLTKYQTDDYYVTQGYHGLKFRSGKGNLDSALHVNLGAYEHEYDGWISNYSYFDTTAYYNFNTLGLQFRLAEIEAAPHDYKLNEGTQYEKNVWTALKVDSLWNYLDKRRVVNGIMYHDFDTDTAWVIQEALAYKDYFHRDPRTGYAIMSLGSLGDSISVKICRANADTIHRLAGADKNLYTNMTYFPGKSTNPGGIGESDAYKWYHLYVDFEINNVTVRHYLVYDTIKPELLVQNPNDQRAFGFRFEKTSIANASMFRFYQPLVGDKQREFFMIETRIPDNHYSGLRNGAGEYLVDDVLNFPEPAGTTKYALYTTGSEEISVTSDKTEATRWAFPFGYQTCEMGYIDNDFLGDTKMWGAPLKAERYNTASKDGKDNKGYEGNYISTSATEAKTDTAFFMLIPATKIIANKRASDPLKYDGILQGINGVTNYYYPNDPTRVTKYFDFGTKNKDVQLYYVCQIKINGNGTSDTTFLTVTPENAFAQSVDQSNVGVVGNIIRWEKFHYYNNSVVQGTTYTNDSTLLQMFAFYGKLGTDANREGRVNENGVHVAGGFPCITPFDRMYQFGQFFIIPAAGYLTDYTKQENVGLKKNLNIGNGTPFDEFRAGVWTDTYQQPPLNKQMFIASSETQSTPGRPASEYILSYRPYFDNFSCPNFITDANKLNYACDKKPADYPNDYADPSSQWAIDSAKISRDTYYYPSTYFKAYKYNPVGKIKRNQAPVAHTELVDSTYMYMLKNGSTSFGGYSNTFSAVRTYKRVGNTNNYNFLGTEMGTYYAAPYLKDAKYLVISEITNKYPAGTDKAGQSAIGDVDQIDADRRYNGDATIDNFYKFTDEMLMDFKWSILEAVFGERFIWSTDAQNAVTGNRWAYVDDKVINNPEKYLKLKKSNVQNILDCNGTVIHSIPYYNIVYTDPTGDEYYMKLYRDKDTVRAEFEKLNTLQRADLADYIKNPDYKPEFKFCFPYSMEEYNKIQCYGDPVKRNKEVYLQTLTTSAQPKPILLKVEKKSSTLSGRELNSLAELNYVDPINKMNVTTWFFADNTSRDDVWIRLQGVPSKDIVGWLRDVYRQPGSDYLVMPTTTPEKDVTYGQLTYKEAMSDINMSRLHFQFVDSAVLGSYDPKRIWYYHIKDDQGRYLTSAGFNPNEVKKPADSLIYAGTGEGYAYFTDSLKSDPEYRQLFGLKWKMDADKNTQPADYAFWVVAGVDPKLNNTPTSDYYYLAEKNSRLVFRYGGGTTRQATEKSAMAFFYGLMDNNVFTDIPEVANDKGVTVIGLNAAVKVVNAKGLVELYTIDGRLFKSVEVTAAEQTIAAPRGVVIVKNGDVTTKVIVK